MTDLSLLTVLPEIVQTFRLFSLNVRRLEVVVPLRGEPEGGTERAVGGAGGVSSSQAGSSSIIGISVCCNYCVKWIG